MNLRLAAGVIFLVSVMLSGCGGTTAAGPKFAAPVGTVSQTTATTNKAALVSGATLNFTNPANKPSVRELDDLDSCTTKTPTTTVDADSDNISTQTRVYACTNIAARAITYTQNGTATITDKDDADPNAGFRYEYAITGSHSGGESWDYSGFWDLTKSTTTLIYSSDFSGTYANTRSSTGTYGGTWSHTITPTNMATPYTTGGAIEFSGYFAYNFTESSVTTNYVFKMTSTGLTYGNSPGCTNFYNGGSYSFTDAAGNVITVEYTSCSAYTVKYNGTTI